MKKFIYSLSMAALFGIYVIAGRTVLSGHLETANPSSGQTLVNQPIPTPVTSVGVLDAQNNKSSNPESPQSNTPNQAPAPTKVKGQYADGNYTGSVEDAYYGNIQVMAVVQDGKLTDVQFLQYPNDRGTSREINSRAMPILKQEAIVSQSASVDTVSGATDSSEAFVKSLENALSQAKNS